MPTVAVYKTDGTQAGEIELSETVFGAEVKESLLHDVVVAHLANCRQGTQSALTRAEVRGGGIKPFRQKGTGRARQGSSRSPQYEGGGVVFAPKPRDYSQKVNKKARKAAIRSALSAKVADGNLIVVDEFGLKAPKTKDMVAILGALSAPSALIVTNATDGVDTAVVRSASNIPRVSTASVTRHGGEEDKSISTDFSVYEILNHDKLVVTKDAVELLEEVFGS